jgi:hypothetical protein
MSITYLRAGRSIRATGTRVGTAFGCAVIQPCRPGWKRIVVTEAEIAAGSVKPPPVKRTKHAANDTPKPERRKRQPKPPPLPRWKALVAMVRDHPCLSVGMDTAKELCDLLEDAHAQLQAAKDEVNNLLFNGR